MGSYKYFTEPLKLMSHRLFMHFLDLKQWVAKAIAVNFFSEESRKNLIAAYMDIRLGRMFSEGERFPAGYYATLGNSDIGKATTAAIRALDLPTSDKLEGLNYAPIDILAAKEHFDNILYKIIEIVDCVDLKKLSERGIYSQCTFEHTFGIIWCDDKPPAASVSNKS